MGRPQLNEQIDAINQALFNYQSLSKPLKLHKAILQVRRKIEEKPTKGTTVNWSNRPVIKDLEQHARGSRRPITRFLDPSIFDESLILQVYRQVVHVLLKHGVDEAGLKEFSAKLEKGGVDVLGLIKATIKGDAKWLERKGKTLGIEPAQLLFIVGIPIQPCLEEIARVVDTSFLEEWWQAPCPVCGRIPVIAKLKERKRYLTCIFCGAEYLADLFLCVKCGNTDPPTLRFLRPEGSPEFRVDFCEKCKHYVKVIDEDRLKKPIPRGLEDILTLSLDLMAKDAGLMRE